MKEFLRSLLTRKFLLALGTTIVFIASGAYVEALTVVLGYLGIEGTADVVSRVKASETPTV